MVNLIGMFVCIGPNRSPRLYEITTQPKAYTSATK